MDWTDWRLVLVVLVLFCVGRLFFERWLDKDIPRRIIRRANELPKFEDVWAENRYLVTLSPAQRRRYYKDKNGPKWLKGGCWNP